MPKAIEDLLDLVRRGPALIDDIKRGDVPPQAIIVAIVGAVVALMAVVQAVKLFFRILKYLVVLVAVGGLLVYLFGRGRPDRDEEPQAAD